MVDIVTSHKAQHKEQKRISVWKALRKSYISIMSENISTASDTWKSHFPPEQASTKENLELRIHISNYGMQKYFSI